MPLGKVSPKYEKVAHFLSSTTLAILLCLLLACLSVVASVFYRGDTSFVDNPGFRLFSSPLFVLPALLLMVNILFCVFIRIARAGGKALNALVVAHIFLLISLLGLMVDGRWGQIYTGYFYLNNPSGIVRDWREGRDRNLPFQIEVDHFAMKRYPYLLKVRVKKNSENRDMGIYMVKEGDSLRISGTSLTLQNLVFDSEKKEIEFDALAGEGPLGTYKAGLNGSDTIAGDYIIYPFAYRDLGLEDMKAVVKLITENASITNEISPNHPAVYDGFNIILIESRFDRYRNRIVGLQITKQPGEKLFWVGILGFFIFMSTHLIGRRIKH